MEQPCSERQYRPPQLPELLSMLESRLPVLCRGMALVGKVCPGVVDTLPGRSEFLGGEVNASMGFVCLDNC